MNITTYRIPYADTDNMGVVYHSNYLIYFEMGRTELMRELGYTYKKMEEDGMYFPVRNITCNYHASAKYDDIITIETSVCELKNASVTFAYKIFCEDRLLTTGTTKHPMVNYAFKPTRIPQELKEMLKDHLITTGESATTSEERKN